MKTNKIILTITISLIALAISCSAQTKTITKKEYEAVQHIAESNFEKIPYKSSTKTEEYSDGKLSETSVINEENIPPKKSRWTEVETAGNKTTKTEIITVDSIEYRRENGGTWVKTDFGKLTEAEMSSGGISGKEAANKKEYTVEEAKFNNQSVRIYTVSTIYDFESNIVQSYRRWINSDNLILKSEEIDSEINSGKVTRHEIVTYEYNPKNLKIEPPTK